MYPEADIPVLQMSMPTLDPQRLFEIGRTLAPLRDEGTLIVGSGFTTHNLRWFDPSAPADAPAPTPSAEFDAWAARGARAPGTSTRSWTSCTGRRPPARPIPRTEHWAPLYVALGAA